MKQLYILRCSLLMLCFLFWNIAARAEIGGGRELKISLEAFPTPFEFWATDAATDGKHLFMLDSENHRILTFFNGALTRIIGGIGNAPGEFYYPTEIVAQSGQIIVNDSGNRRIQILSSAGRSLAMISVKKTWGLAAFADRIYVGNPAENHLVDVYDISGRVLPPIGEMITPNEVFEDRMEGREEIHGKAVNRVQIATDHEGFVWIAFQHLPLLRKFSPGGKLLFERRLSLDGIEATEWSVRHLSARSTKLPSINIDGVQLPVIIRDIEYDHRAGTVVVLLADGRVVILNRSGEMVRLATFLDLKSSALAASPSPDGHLLILCSHDSLPQMAKDFWTSRRD